MYKSVQWLVTDTCKWAAAGMAEMDTCTLACGSHCSCQLLPSCPYWQWIKISSVHLDLIKADQSAAVKAFRSIPSIAPLAYSYVWTALVNWNSSVLVRVTGLTRLGHSNQLDWPLHELYSHFYYYFLHSDMRAADINLRFAFLFFLHLLD